MVTQRYAINSVVSGTIASFETHRVNVVLEGNVRAYIREREIAWQDAAQHAWQGTAKVGDSVQAKVIRHDRQGRPELSLRVMSRDPWDNVGTRYHVGALVHGVVRGVTDEALFVALEPGVEGILRQDELSFMRHADLRETFWPGDSVYVIVQSLVPEERRMSLTLEGVRARRWEALKISSQETKRVAAARKEIKSGDDLDALVWADLDGYYRFVVVDDDERERNHIVKCLHAAAQHVQCAEDVAGAKRGLQNYTDEPVTLPIIVILDKQMPSGNGDEAIPELHRAFPNAHFILTSHALASDEIAKWRRDGVPAIQKPLTRFALVEALQQLFEEGVEQASKQLLPNPTAPFLNIGSDPEAKLTSWLTRIRVRTSAQCAVIFVLSQTDTADGRVETLAGSAVANFELRQDKVANTIFSPVRDVALSSETYLCVDVNVHGQKLGYLRQLGHFGACLGVPVPATTAAHYALFLFWDNPLKITPTEHDAMLDSVKITAEVMGGIIEQRLLLGKIMDNQRMIVAGEMASAVTHDIYTQVGTLHRTPDELRNGLSRFESNKQSSPEKTATDLHFLRRKIDELQSATEKIDQVSKLFKTLSLQTSMQYLRVEQIIEQAVELARRVAESNYKRISVEFVDVGMLVANSDPMRLMQVLQNLILNAVQQLGLTKPSDMGRVIVSATIATSVLSEPKVDVIQIRVEDNGPGISALRHERIFDLGVTNREGGSGIGLYITRALVHQLGGRVQVESSAIGWGSCFLIELPCTY